MRMKLTLGTAVMVAVSACHLMAGEIRFENRTESAGMVDLLSEWEMAHAGAWGDVTGNGYPDLFIAAFSDRPLWNSPDAPPANMLFLNDGKGNFVLSPEKSVQMEGQRSRGAMALFADFTNNGSLDLVLGLHGRGPEGPILFLNDGKGGFTDKTADAGKDWPLGFHSRNMAVIDLDWDGYLDLILIDGRYGNRGEQKLVALRNLGNGKFEDYTEKTGFPDGRTRGLGSAIGDLNDDGRLDIFVADSNRLFLSQPDGTYKEYKPGFFRQPRFRDWPCGAVFADLTGNGLLDLVFTIHGKPPQLFVYVNRGLDARGEPIFEEVTREAGLAIRFPREGNTGEPLKGAQLAVVDLNHNGRRDILMGMVHHDENGELKPVVFRNEGVVNGVPQFSTPPPESLVGYYATAPVADYDRDGRMDIFMATWFKTLGSHLFRNVSDAGNHLIVGVAGVSEGFNPMGIGATVRLYRAGHMGQADHLLGRGDITIGNGYTVGEETMAHFGLAEETHCDVEVRWQGKVKTLERVPVNQTLQVEF